MRSRYRLYTDRVIMLFIHEYIAFMHARVCTCILCPRSRNLRLICSARSLDDVERRVEPSRHLQPLVRSSALRIYESLEDPSPLRPTHPRTRPSRQVDI
jgi:hypothetical protein